MTTEDSTLAEPGSSVSALSQTVSPPNEQRSDPDNPPWSIWSALLAWFSSVALIFIIPNLCVLPYVAYHYRGSRVLDEQVLLSDKTVVLIFILASLPVHAITFFILWAVGTRLGKFSFKDVFGWRWSANFGLGKSISLGALLFFVAWAILVLFRTKPTDLDRILASSRPAALFLACLAVATAPLVEETTYRGLLYPALQRVTGRLPAVVIVAFLFAGLHIYQYRQSLSVILSISLLSFVLTLVRARTGLLLPCYVIHLVFNSIQSILIVADPYLHALFQMIRHEAASGMLPSLALLLTWTVK